MALPVGFAALPVGPVALPVGFVALPVGFAALPVGPVALCEILYIFVGDVEDHIFIFIFTITCLGLAI